jgi:hypothetical protein
MINEFRILYANNGYTEKDFLKTDLKDREIVFKNTKSCYNLFQHPDPS